MRIDNSSRGNLIFAEKLAGIQKSDSQSDSIGNDKEEQKILKNRIDTLKKEGMSLKPLTQALQQVAQQQNSPMMITESQVNTNQRNVRERIINAINKK